MHLHLIRGIVCSIKDSKGKPYDLLRFADEDTGFISHKTLEGKELKTLEWPGVGTEP